MHRFCRAVIGGLTILYVVALTLFFIGTFGWFGSAKGPLAGVFLVPLGLPWNRLLSPFPEASWPWLAALAPAINILILRAFCKRVAVGRKP